MQVTPAVVAGHRRLLVINHDRRTLTSRDEIEVAAADLSGRNRAHRWERHSGPQAFKAAEDKVLVFANRASHHAAELVQVMEAAALAGGIVLPGVGIEDAVLPVIEHRPVPEIGAALEGCGDVPTARASILGVVGVHHHLHLLYGFDVRYRVVSPFGRNRRPVQQELSRSRAPAVHRPGVALGPGAHERVARRSEGALGEHHSRRQLHQQEYHQ